VDKASHARGHESPLVHDALAIVDDVVARLRRDAERGGWWDATHLWIVSDHGHSPVHAHEDLAAVVASTGRRTVAHPWSAAPRAEAAVMVSGNAMAHVYVDVARRERAWWPALAARHGDLAELLLARDATDLLLLPLGPDRCEVRSRARGAAIVERSGACLRYTCVSGDPLVLGGNTAGTADVLLDATRDGPYPDAVVQVVALAGSQRAGDIVLSAASGWDYRARYEPIPHRSAHGALHRDHMVVPLLTNRATARAPRRTVDVFASALDALEVEAPSRMDGRSFLAR
jgi:arylsulfatase A-like enzyme